MTALAAPGATETTIATGEAWVNIVDSVSMIWTPRLLRTRSPGVKGAESSCVPREAISKYFCFCLFYWSFSTFQNIFVFYIQIMQLIAILCLCIENE